MVTRYPSTKSQVYLNYFFSSFGTQRSPPSHSLCAFTTEIDSKLILRFEVTMEIILNGSIKGSRLTPNMEKENTRLTLNQYGLPIWPLLYVNNCGGHVRAKREGGGVRGVGGLEREREPERWWIARKGVAVTIFKLLQRDQSKEEYGAF